MKVAIMQPYFAPYIGYFRLFDVDLFVFLDDVQFPRRGWVHRNKLIDRNGSPQWFTLPIEKADFSAQIKDLRFAWDSVSRMEEESRRFPAISKLPVGIEISVMSAGGRLVPYAVQIIERCCKHLNIRMAYSYSHLMPIDPEARGQQRIIEICKYIGATEYLNSPGGVGIYDASEFARHGIKLEFLPKWEGPMESVLEVIAYKNHERAAA